MGDISRAGAMIHRDPITNTVNFLAGCTINFNEELEQQVVDGFASAAGCDVKTDLALTEKKSSLKLTVGTKTIDDLSFEWMIVNDRRVATPSIVVPKVITAPVIGGVVAAPDLVADQPNVSVTILRTDRPGKVALTFQAGGTGVTATTFEVGAGQVTVDATYEGLSTLVYYFETVTAQQGFGGDRSINRYNDVEFLVRICGDRMTDKNVWFPRCTSTTGLSFEIDQDEYTREYTAFTDVQRGFTRQFAIWDAA